MRETLQRKVSDLSVLLVSGSGYSAAPKPEFQKVLPAISATSKGNDHG